MHDLPDRSVGVIISDSVVNFSPDKEAVIREAFRVLKPGGRRAIADIVLRGSLPEPCRKATGLWTGCIAGFLVDPEYASLLKQAGSDEVSLEATHVYDSADMSRMAGEADRPLGELGDNDRQVSPTDLDGAAMSAFVRAREPANA
jgi:SAM-dependent methyltransferase